MRMSPLCIFSPRILHPRGSHTAAGTFVPPCSPLDQEKVKELQQFISVSKRLLVMTGAGISTESGIPDYRSEKVGLYARTDRRPIQHVDFVRSAKIRQRYWARNFVGWPQFSSHQPNAAHLALSNWERLGKLYWLVTQNVDALHTKAGSQRLTELHGCMHRVLCLHCGEQTPRELLQDQFESLNPTWGAEAHGVAPDGDVFLTEDQVRTFRVPSCTKCGGPLKPDVVFFGDTVNRDKVDFVLMRVKEADALLVVGSSLQVYSGYKFILAAHEKKLPIAILNIGPTRKRTHQAPAIPSDLKMADAVSQPVEGNASPHSSISSILDQTLGANIQSCYSILYQGLGNSTLFGDGAPKEHLCAPATAPFKADNSGCKHHLLFRDDFLIVGGQWPQYRGQHGLCSSLAAF